MGSNPSTSLKRKTPIWVFFFLVEARGIEPLSEKGSAGPSTCLFLQLFVRRCTPKNGLALLQGDYPWWVITISHSGALLNDAWSAAAVLRRQTAAFN